MRKKLLRMNSFILVVLISLSLVPLGNICTHQVSESSYGPINVIDSHPSTTGAIVVDSDDDFLVAPWTGSGTSGDPYTIQNLVIDITGQAGSCVVILDTNKWFSVINCTLIGGDLGYGVLLSNTTNGLLNDNRIYNHTSCGIRVSKTTHTNISGNLIKNCYNGIEIVYQSYNNTIKLNEFVQSTNFGLFAGEQSGENVISENSFLDNRINALDDAVNIDNYYDSNLWTDYAGDDLNTDAVGDTPHTIAGAFPKNEDTNPMILPPTRPAISWNEEPSDQLNQLGYDFEYVLNITAYGFEIVWSINDTTNFDVSSTGLITNATFLPEGQRYGLFVEVEDVYSNSINASFEVAVIDTTPPEWVEKPTNQIVEFGEHFQYDLDAIDSSPPLLWCINDTTNFAINATSGLIVNNSQLAVGSYGLRVEVNDSWSQSRTSEIVIEVVDTIPPEWNVVTSPQSIEYGDTYQYDLDAFDIAGIDSWWVSPAKYFSINSNGTIRNSSLIPVGEYTVYVWVNDTHNQINGSSFKLIVEDTTDPIWIIEPQGVTLERGERLDIQMVAFDLSGISWYRVNNSLFSTTNDGLIVVSGNPTPGNYPLLVFASDPYANIMYSEILIVVVDTKSPTWVIEPTDRYVELGQSIDYQLEAYDPSGLDSWSVNDTTHFSIIDGMLQNEPTTPVGEYIVEVSVEDIYGHSMIDVFTITIQDTMAPTFDHQIVHQFVTSGDYLSYDLNATDYSGAIIWSTNNTDLFDIDEEGTITSLTPLDVGKHYVRISASDLYGNSRFVDLCITVLEEDLVPVDWMTITVGASIVLVSTGVLLVVFKKRG
ncbi:MAG: hypothetical protein GF411_20245 [Candidatus Lokiarchaeota archaeon]|nr:hypothetical protein [Candidatus Lokiarchaeota archaeon]